MGRKAKAWSVVVGGHGHKVKAVERGKAALISLRWWDSANQCSRWEPLGHKDRTRAEEQARELSAQLLSASLAVRSPRVTVLELLARYESEVIPHKKPGQAADDRRRVELWEAFIGNREARAVDFPTIDRFVRERKVGAIKIPSVTRLGKPRKLSKHPNDTTIGADIVFLQSVFNWSLKVAMPDGSRLLSENPIRDYQRPKNKNPKRPLATYDRFLAVRAKADEADPQRLFGSFLDLIECLGWRVSAVCNLQMTDIDRKPAANAPFGQIHKRADSDKEGVDVWLPLSESCRVAVDRIIERNPVLGDLYLFPARRKRQTDRPAPWSRFYARDLLARAEKLADLEPIVGGDFHPYRRAFITARKHLPAVDVAAVTGHRKVESLAPYTQSDAETRWRVMSDTNKVREVKGA